MYRRKRPRTCSYMARNLSQRAFGCGGNVCLLEGPICQCFTGRGYGVGQQTGRLPGYHRPICRGDDKTNRALEPTQKQPTPLSSLNVNIFCGCSRRATPLIPDHLKLGPCVKIRLQKAFYLTSMRRAKSHLGKAR